MVDVSVAMTCTPPPEVTRELSAVPVACPMKAVTVSSIVFWPRITPAARLKEPPRERLPAPLVAVMLGVSAAETTTESAAVDEALTVLSSVISDSTSVSMVL